MNLNQFVAQAKRDLWDDLRAGRDPRAGEWDSTSLAEARALGESQIGAANFAPHYVNLEFIFSDGKGTTRIFTVRLPTPERVVFLPVPKWVVESIWQGDIDGSFHFESEAERLVQEFQATLSVDENAKLFGPKQATRRE